MEGLTKSACHCHADIDEEDKVLEMHEKFEHINIEWLRVKQCINKRISQKLQLLQALSHLQESLGTVASAAAAAYAAAKFCLEKGEIHAHGIGGWVVGTTLNYFCFSSYCR
jgi:hypothetical protein